jgi:bacterioferritin
VKSQQSARNTAKTPKQQLIDGLNEDLRGEFQAVIMYRLFASMVQGPYRQELRTFFANEIPEELTHAQLLADKISALGGTPAAAAAPVTVASDAKGMFEVAPTAEIDTLERYIRRRKQAEAAGEHGLATEIDTLIADETNHRDELRQMLARWPNG